MLAVCNDSYMQARSEASTAANRDADEPARDELVDAVLGSSRALVAVAARSLANLAEDVTLAQYRFLIELASRGPQRLADLATALGVDRSTATRMCDRLVRKRLVTRRRAQEDRRTVRVSLTGAGAELVAEVSRRRRVEIATIVGRMPAADRDPVVRALRAFADAAGEVPEQDWSLGWDLGLMAAEPVVGTQSSPSRAFGGADGVGVAGRQSPGAGGDGLGGRRGSRSRRRSVSRDGFRCHLAGHRP